MRQYFYLLSLFMALFPNSVFGQTLADWRAAVVKIESFSCSDRSRRLEGTGILILKDGITYVLTSEHVVLHDSSSGSCHRVMGKNTGLLSADVNSGLALLEFQEDLPAEILNRGIPFGRHRSVTIDDRVGILGFPLGSRDLITLTGGRVRDPESRRGLIPSVLTLIESDRTPVEYGFSGGPLIAQDLKGDWRLAGLVSHQVLRRGEGRASRIDEMEQAAEPFDIALSIPAREIDAWMKRALDQQSQIEWARVPTEQLRGLSTLTSGPLQFTAISQQDFVVSGAPREMKMAGPLRYIGGGDGAGVGGASAHSFKSKDLIAIRVSLRPGLTRHEKQQVLVNEDLEKWRQWVLAGYDVQVAFFKRVDENALVPIVSPSQFLTLLARKEGTPIAIRTHRSNQTGPALSEIEHASRETQLRLQQMMDLSAPVEIQAWFLRIRDLCLLAENLLLLPDELKVELDNARAWNFLYSTHFDEAVALETDLTDLYVSLKQKL